MKTHIVTFHPAEGYPISIHVVARNGKEAYESALKMLTEAAFTVTEKGTGKRVSSAFDPRPPGNVYVVDLPEGETL